jgi:outer membrane protein assembly factor BamB
LWKAEIPGRGNSSPIVSHGRIFLTTSLSEDDNKVRKSALSLDLDSGELLWETAVGIVDKSKRHPKNTPAAPTPVTDGETVFVHFGDLLAALDRDGEMLWKIEIDPQYREFSHYGAASSPVLSEGGVVVFQDRETEDAKPGWIAAFNQDTGVEIWRQTWTDTCCSYVTPLVRRRGEREEVIVVMAGSVRALDALSGEEVWRRQFGLSQPVASAVTGESHLVVFSGAHGHRRGAAFELSSLVPDNDTYGALWQTTKMIPQTSSPVLVNGLVFTVTDQGVMNCINVLDGRRHWKERLPEGTYMSSLMAAGDKVFAVSSTGHTAVVRARKAFKLLSVKPLADGRNASPAVAGDSLLIRTKSALYRIGRRGAP